MMDWDTYATLLDMEQTKRAENNEPPLFGENQEELLMRKNRQKMITAIKMMKEACAKRKSCLDCPFEYCDLGNEPMFWKSEEE